MLDDWTVWRDVGFGSNPGFISHGTLNPTTNIFCLSFKTNFTILLLFNKMFWLARQAIDYRRPMKIYPRAGCFWSLKIRLAQYVAPFYMFSARHGRHTSVVYCIAAYHLNSGDRHLIELNDLYNMNTFPLAQHMNVQSKHECSDFNTLREISYSETADPFTIIYQSRGFKPLGSMRRVVFFYITHWQYVVM